MWLLDNLQAPDPSRLHVSGTLGGPHPWMLCGSYVPLIREMWSRSGL